jgi:hypothetical protein
MSGVIICRFNKGYARCDKAKCWNCNSTKAVAHMTTNPYLGDIFTCVECGDKWSDGEGWGRPFRRGWRRESIKEARAIWDAEDTMTWEEACKRQDELFRDYFKEDA